MAIVQMWLGYIFGSMLVLSEREPYVWYEIKQKKLARTVNIFHNYFFYVSDLFESYFEIHKHRRVNYISTHETRQGIHAYRGIKIILLTQ